MNIKEYIAALEKLIVELKEFDENLPCEMIVTAPHICCNCGDGYCYESGTDFEFSSLCINKEYTQKTKRLKKIWIRGDC